MTKRPVHPIAKDGIYPRCVYCNTEIYGPATIDYSIGKAIPLCCDLPLPKSYVKVKLKKGIGDE